MGASHFYEQGTIGMGQESFLYGNGAQLISLSAIFPHCGHLIINLESWIILNSCCQGVD
jgi:hypothetical protein